jgi:hypothetical protein
MHYATEIDRLAESVLNDLAVHAKAWSSIGFGVQPCSDEAREWVLGCKDRKIVAEDCQPAWMSYRVAQDASDMGSEAIRRDLFAVKSSLSGDGSEFHAIENGNLMLYVPVKRFLPHANDGANDMELLVSVRSANPNESEMAIWMAMYRIQGFCDCSGCYTKTKVPPSYNARVMLAASRADSLSVRDY